MPGTHSEARPTQALRELAPETLTWERHQQIERTPLSSLPCAVYPVASLIWDRKAGVLDCSLYSRRRPRTPTRSYSRRSGTGDLHTACLLGAICSEPASCQIEAGRGSSLLMHHQGLADANIEAGCAGPGLWATDSASTPAFGPNGCRSRWTALPQTRYLLHMAGCRHVQRARPSKPTNHGHRPRQSTYQLITYICPGEAVSCPPRAGTARYSTWHGSASRLLPLDRGMPR